MEYFVFHFMLLNFKFIDGSFQNFMVAIIVVVVFMVSFFKVTYSSFQFLKVISISFLGYNSHFSWLHFHVFFFFGSKCTISRSHYTMKFASH
jgi:hypothetical protein